MNGRKIYTVIKNIIDVVISIIVLIILSPLLLLIAIIIKIDSKGPVIFKHKRYGKNGKIIYIYKFRTMVDDAENKARYFTPEQMESYKLNYKLKDDPRITRVGKILRVSSMDELPQFLNVIKGDMAIIGPRPIIEEELERYKENKYVLLSVKPGITGLWAASGRSLLKYEDRIDLELCYAKNMSFLLDLKCAFKTVYVVIKKIGAV